MSALLPLRSLGDFVIDSYIIKFNSNKLKFNRLILPSYLGFLSSLIASESIKVDMIPLNVKSNLLSLFTIKYLLSKHTIRELIQLEQEIKKLNIQKVNLYLQEYDLRNKLLKNILKTEVVAPVKNSLNVYERRLELYTGQKTFDLQSLKLNGIHRVIIFPDSRLKRKELDKDTLYTICNYLNSNSINYTIALFQNNQNPTASTELIKFYSNLEELKTLIEVNDFIISCDSMPLHLANYLNKPHFCIYNKIVNYEWITPQMKRTHAFCVSNQLPILYNYLDNVQREGHVS